ncbi:hypothetical protein COEREDRAFT_88274 [Coemansia reversa NRRL 1564]|uniref:Uncharacterized protein n=1 Tax=Coemansia reversa (strain ATCC 12441 / NRRL 1564) TaxID=763665 RepID=A0A2G5B7H8_COERN|nr:hypothetical protein COEREDRAFT_88274 [Coemansia reversa NRRL 1564]|eukprot:PIA14950.1 hypothetical protein COEREDRAFT_88274 [Coemansia reversa NRRL 1564]
MSEERLLGLIHDDNTLDYVKPLPFSLDPEKKSLINELLFQRLSEYEADTSKSDDGFVIDETRDLIYIKKRNASDADASFMCLKIALSESVQYAKNPQEYETMLKEEEEEKEEEKSTD